MTDDVRDDSGMGHRPETFRLLSGQDGKGNIMTTEVQQRREFTGNVYPDGGSVRMDGENIKRVGTVDVPGSLRDNAAYVLGDMSGGTWWMVGQFRYADSHDYETAAARRVGGQIQYGIQK